MVYILVFQFTKRDNYTNSKLLKFKLWELEFSEFEQPCTHRTGNSSQLTSCQKINTTTTTHCILLTGERNIICTPTIMAPWSAMLNRCRFVNTSSHDLPASRDTNTWNLVGSSSTVSLTVPVKT